MNKNLKILLIDDDNDFGYILKKGLCNFDYCIKQFTRSQDVIDWLDSETHEEFDVIILDYYLSDSLSGLDVLRLIRDRGINTAIMMMSSNEDTSLVSEVIDNGANLYIAKDFKQPMSYVDSKIKTAMSIAKMSNNIKKIFTGGGAE